MAGGVVAERQLVVKLIGDSRSLERTFTRSSRAAKGFEHDISRASRGALSAAVSFRGLGRALAFGSFQFLGGAGIVFGIKSTIQAAEESQKVLGQTQNAVERSGQSWAKYGKQIQDVALAQSKLSGFDDERLLSTFSNLERRTGNVNKALALNALAANVARGRNISLEAAHQIVLKASLGLAGALRRVGIAVGKHATALQLIDALSKKYGKSAEAYGKTAAGAQDRFGVAIQNTQEAIGAGLLPTITTYLNKGSEWLNQTKNQQRIQRDVSDAVKITADVARDLAAGVKAAADAVGGFKHLAELLIGLKLGAVLFRWAKAARELAVALAALNAASLASSLGGIGTTAATSGGPVARLLGDLRRIGRIATLSVAFRFPGLAKFLPFLQVLAGATGLAAAGSVGAVLASSGAAPNVPRIGEGTPRQLARLGAAGKIPTSVLVAAAKAAGIDPSRPAGFAFQNKEFVALVFEWAKQRGLITAGVSAGGAASEALVKAAHGLGLKVNELGGDFGAGKGGLNLTAAQRNTFFDNTIGRILLRGGLGDIKAQLAAIAQASALISQRIAKTKDITRKLNLEDQLLQLGAQAKDIRAQIAQSFIDALQFNVTKAGATAGLGDDLRELAKLQGGIQQRIKAEGKTLELQQELFDVQQQIVQARKDQAAKRIADLTSKQFRQLGLTATGDEITPGVANLKKQLASLGDRIAGTKLDTPKLQAQLARFRKVLSEGLVPKDVRAKIRDMLDGIREELGKGTQNLTKFRHVSTTALLSGLGLSPDVARQLQLRLSQVGPNGSFPGARSGAFAAAGARNDINLTTTVVLDRNVVGRSVTKVQQKDAKRSTGSRRGTYAGRH